ncbi:hypothetical protein SESBI_21533 [Sesbania bispinosa]|nr:hypothetical protein SESBI_21533 [Sesbania bispinosa]
MFNLQIDKSVSNENGRLSKIRKLTVVGERRLCLCIVPVRPPLATVARGCASSDLPRRAAQLLRRENHRVGSDPQPPSSCFLPSSPSSTAIPVDWQPSQLYHLTPCLRCRRRAAAISHLRVQARRRSGVPPIIPSSPRSAAVLIAAHHRVQCRASHRGRGHDLRCTAAMAAPRSSSSCSSPFFPLFFSFPLSLGFISFSI